jgi:hypothetical protein
MAHPFEEKNYRIILKSRELPSKRRRLPLKRDGPKRTCKTKVKKSKLSDEITLLFN